MPTIAHVKGYRLYFVSFDGSEPIHVHLRKGNRAAKVWLAPLRVAWSDFGRHENREIVQIVQANAGLIKDSWHEHFGV